MANHHQKLDTLKVQRAAAKTRLMVEELRRFVSSMRFPEATPRKQLSAALLMASMEHAEAVAFLLEHGPHYHGMPAMTLLRPQIECFLRGVFFHSDAATDQEVTDFIEHDELPKRTDRDGKKATHLLGADGRGRYTSVWRNIQAAIRSIFVQALCILAKGASRLGAWWSRSVDALQDRFIKPRVQRQRSRTVSVVGKQWNDFRLCHVLFCSTHCQRSWQ